MIILDRFNLTKTGRNVPEKISIDERRPQRLTGDQRTFDSTCKCLSTVLIVFQERWHAVVRKACAISGDVRI
jgi:hypothetical protein